jgi:hypothetical protein
VSRTVMQRNIEVTAVFRWHRHVHHSGMGREKGLWRWMIIP